MEVTYLNIFYAISKHFWQQHQLIVLYPHLVSGTYQPANFIAEKLVDLLIGVPKTFWFLGNNTGYKLVSLLSLSLSIYIIVQKEKVFKFLGGIVGLGAGLSVSLGVGLNVGSAYW